MEINIISINNKPPNWINQGIDEYKKRLTNIFDIKTITIKPDKKISSKKLKLEQEEKKIKSYLKPNSYVIALDEKGKNLTSIDFSILLDQWITNNLNPYFIIGSADGINNSLKNNSSFLLSLSKFTLPHHFAKIILLEQIYRAYSIIKKHPYHRD